MRGRTHTGEFKLDVGKQIATGEKRPAQVCRAHQLAESVLLRWRKEYEQRGEQALSPRQLSGAETLETKVAELERFAGQVALENQVLRKALSRAQSHTD